VGRSVASYGRKLNADFHTFGRKVVSTSGKIERGVERFDNTVGRIQNVLEKVSREDPTGITNIARQGLGVVRQASHIVGDGAGLARNIAKGNIQEAVQQGKHVFGDVTKLGGSVAGLALV
jgi:hypothetical protein